MKRLLTIVATVALSAMAFFGSPFDAVGAYSAVLFDLGTHY